MDPADIEPPRLFTGELLNIILQPMSPEVLMQIIVLLVLLFLSAIISGSEVAYFSLRPADLHLMQDSEKKGDGLVSKLISKPKRLLATILIGNNLVNIAAVIISTSITASLFDFSMNPTAGFVIQVVVVTFLLVLFGEVLPKIYATQHPKDFARSMSIPLLIMDKLFRPFSMLMVAGTNLIDKRMKKRGYEVNMSELTHAIDITSDTNTPLEDKQMLKGIVKFGDTDVKQIMKGRMDAFAIEIDTTFDKVIEQILEKGYSRIPVYENNFDKVLGILYIKDLLAHLHKGPEFKWQDLLRPVFFVPESKKINALLKEFQDTKIHLAIVVDEYGGSSGLVTLEDILEEIVGEINDELDEEEITYSRLDENNVVFEGKALLNDVCRIMNIERKVFEKVEGEGADTLAGLILELAGRIPLKSEVIEFANYIFVIESVDKRRIKRVKMTIKQDDDEADTDPKA